MTRQAMYTKDKVDKMLTLARAKPGTVKKLLSPAKKDLIDALSELSLNLLHGVIPVSPQRKGQLSRHKTNLRLLAKKGVSVKKRKQILQKGGFIGSLVAATLPFAIQGIGALVKARKKKKKSTKKR